MFLGICIKGGFYKLMFKHFEIKKVSEPFHTLKISEQNKQNIFLFPLFYKEQILSVSE